MADKKKFSLGGIDNAAEEKGSFIKTLWQILKFLVVSGLVTIIQLVLANVLPLVFDSVWLQGWIVGIIAKVDWAWLQSLARTIASLAAGLVQMLVLFPMEKFVLLKEKKEDKSAEAAADAAAE